MSSANSAQYAIERKDFMRKQQREILQDVVQRLKSTHNVGQMFLDNLSDENLKETALYKNFWTINVKNKNMFDLLEVVFDLEIK